MPNSYNIYEALEVSTLALLIKREARGEVYDAMLGVGWSVRNRVHNPRWWGHDWLSVMSKPFQYSSISPPPKDNDPNLRVYLDMESDSLIIQAAEAAYWGSTPDNTGGATHYFDRSLDDNPPSWATDGTSEHVCDIGSLHFYKAH